MKMPESFVSAASRHLEDAGILFLASRFDNAAYLSGYTVECALFDRNGGQHVEAMGT
jgi:hypothetical protein